MLVDPTHTVAEILGEPSAEMRNPVNADYRCPFINKTCTKTSQQISGPYPVCTVRHGQVTATRSSRLICVCPKRFYEDTLIEDIIKHCWPGNPPTNYRTASEIQMNRLGKVDLVIADLDSTNTVVKKFLSVELQAVDTSGSYQSVYQAVINREGSAQTSFGINWKNVRKRLIPQIVEKGFYHQAWGARLVTVLQTPLYDRIHSELKFDELPASDARQSVVFMLYDYKPDPDRENAYRLTFDRVVATSHNSLMMASLYQDVPPVRDFHERIVSNLQ